MLSNRTDETADKLALSLRHHIHNISPRHLRRPRYRNTLATLSPTLSRRRSRALTNHNSHKTLSRRDNRKANITPTQHMPRCTRSRNRTSPTMPRRTMMATTATAACPCPRHTKPLVVPGSRNSETTNSPLAGTEHAPTQGVLNDKTTHYFACTHGRHGMRMMRTLHRRRLRIIRTCIARVCAMQVVAVVRAGSPPVTHCLDSAVTRVATCIV